MGTPKLLAREPATTLQQEYSSPGATATSWADGRQQLQDAEIYWLATVRPEGRPHIAPLMAVLVNGGIYVCTGENERKAKNLAENERCILLTGANLMSGGLDIVVEGEARCVSDHVRLQQVADAYVAKYGEAWRYTVRDGAFYHGDGSLREEHTARANVYEIVPGTAFGFGRGATFSQTRWRFA